MLSAVVTAFGSAVAAQGAPLALSTFSEICIADLKYGATTQEFSNAGWLAAPADLQQLFAQDMVDPNDSALFVKRVGDGGNVLAASLSENRGLFATRNKTLCMLRLFVETPQRIRTDFSAQQTTQPNKTTDSGEVMADVWNSYANGRIIGFRAVLLPEGYWMITLSRVLVDG